MGRPTKYEGEKTIKYAVKLANLGATNDQIADFLEVNVDTLYEWGEKHPEFSESLKRAKEIHDDQLVEKSLLKRATGYIRTIERLDKDGCAVACQEELPPDPTSMIFWLKNRQPQKWRDRQELEHSGNLSVIVNVNKKEPPKK